MLAALAFGEMKDACAGLLACVDDGVALDPSAAADRAARIHLGAGARIAGRPRGPLPFATNGITGAIPSGVELGLDWLHDFVSLNPGP
jgi:hypothetical protein